MKTSSVRVAVVGCGNVSRYYLSDLAASPWTEPVAVCDERLERARAAAEQYGVARAFDDAAAMLAAVPSDLVVNLTAMPAHAPINQLALEAGRHVYCEKPIATTLSEGEALLALARERGVRLWGAPNVVCSPAFAAMARALRAGEIGRPCAAHGRYGHTGPDWGAWFFQEGGGALFDLGVYHLTTLTGLLGPAKSVVALCGIAVGTRPAEGREVAVTAEDNVMLLIDFGDACFGCVQTGFVYGGYKEEWTVEVCGTEGSVTLLGHDWAPLGVDVCSARGAKWERRAQDPEGYGWWRGATTVAQALINGTEPLLSAEHALHVLEVMLAAKESARTGRRVPIRTTFPWPIVA